MSPTERESQAVTMRTLTSICQDAKDNKNGCKFEPLLSIELDHVISDKLNILLRTMDVLLRNVINSAIGHGNYTTRGQGHDDILNGPMIKKLQRAISDCGITFTLTKKRSLVGPDKLKALKKLSETLNECQPVDVSDMVMGVNVIW